MKVNTKIRKIIVIAAPILIWAEFLISVAFDQRAENATYQSPTVQETVREVMYNVDPNGNPHYIYVNRRQASGYSQPVGLMMEATILVQVAALIVFAIRVDNADKKSVRDNNEAGEQ